MFKSKKNNFNNKNILVIICVIAITIIIFISLVFKVSVSKLSNGVNSTVNKLKNGTGYPYSFIGKSLIDAKKLSTNICVVNESETITLDSTAKVISNIPLKFSNPIAFEKNNNLLLIECGGTLFKIQNSSKVKYEGTSKNKLLTGAMGTKGQYALVMRGIDNMSSLILYNKSNKEIFSWNSANDIITTCDISEDGLKLAAAVINAENGDLKTKVLVFDIKNNRIENEYDYNSNNITQIKFLKGNFLFCKGDLICDIVKNGTKKFSEDLTVNKLSGLSITNNTVVLATAKYGGKSENTVKMLKPSGKESFLSTINGNILSVSNNEKYTAVITSTEILVLNRNGNVIAKKAVEQNIKTSYTIGTNIYIISATGITEYKIFRLIKSR